MTLGERLRETRLNQGLTMKQLSEKTFLNVKTISLMERDLKNVTLADLDSICEGLGVRVVDILREDYEPLTFIELKAINKIQEKLDGIALFSRGTHTIKFTSEELRVIVRLIEDAVRDSTKGK